MLLRQLVEALPCFVPAPMLDPLAQPVGRRDLELELGDHAEHADRNLGCMQEAWIVLPDLDDVAGRGDDPHAPHARRKAAEPQAGAVRGGRDGAGDLLGDDVALVCKREAFRPEWHAELADRRRRSDDDAAATRVDRTDASEPAQVEQESIGRDDRRERVPGSRDTYRQSAPRRISDEGRNLVLARRRSLLLGAEGLVAYPVGPGAHFDIIDEANG